MWRLPWWGGALSARRGGATAARDYRLFGAGQGLRVGLQLFQGHNSGSNRDGANVVGLGSQDVVGMIADQRNRAFAADPLLLSGAADGNPHQAGTVVRQFGESAKTEIGRRPARSIFRQPIRPTAARRRRPPNGRSPDGPGDGSTGSPGPPCRIACRGTVLPPENR